MEVRNWSVGNEFPDRHTTEFLLVHRPGDTAGSVDIIWHHQPDLSDEPQRQNYPV